MMLTLSQRPSALPVVAGCYLVPVLDGFPGGTQPISSTWYTAFLGWEHAQQAVATGGGEGGLSPPWKNLSPP